MADIKIEMASDMPASISIVDHSERCTLLIGRIAGKLHISIQGDGDDGNDRLQLIVSGDRPIEGRIAINDMFQEWGMVSIIPHKPFPFPLENP